MKPLVALFIASAFVIQFAQAQENDQSNSNDKSSKTTVNLGIGAGLTYGGLGARLVLNPSEVFSLFAALGYNLNDVAYNVGPIISIPSKSRTKFYLTAMYGYNAVIIIEGLEDFNETFHGISAGVGIKVMSKRNPGSYWDFGLIVPFRSSDFNDKWDYIKNNPLFEVKNNPWPVNITIGYNFKL